MDLPHYMETSIRESDYVVLVCTLAFADKANRGSGGVGYEKNIVTGEMFTKQGNDSKFVPLLRSGLPEVSLPSYLRSKYYVDFRMDEDFEAALDKLLRHIHQVPAIERPPIGPMPFATRLNAQRPVSSAVPDTEADIGQPEPEFDLERFKELMNYAYNPGGLNLNRQDAMDWAQDRLRDRPPFDLQKFIALRDYAYSAAGLNLSRPAAIDWAHDRLRDGPPFNLNKFIELVDHAYSPAGLNLSRPAAMDWALKQMGHRGPISR
jgi:hypothetical protein